MRIIATLVATAALTAGCSSSSEDEQPAPSVTDAVAEAEADDVDVTAELTAGQPWADLVTTATQTEPGRVQVETTIVDPRGDAGSPAAQQAITLCEGMAAWLRGQGVAEPKGSVMEADGTTFVVLGHPTYGPGCAEV